MMLFPAFRKKQAPRPFDPQLLNDPVAMQTQWIPLENRDSATFYTRELKVVSNSHMEFRPSIQLVLFSLVVIAFALVPPYVISLRDEIFRWSFSTFFWGFASLCFAGAGIFLLYSGFQPNVFDKGAGTYFRKRFFPKRAFESRLSEIHALQIVPEYVSDKDGGYYSYELNLVFKDGTRKNVVDHGDLQRLKSDASVLSKFLGVPLWSAV